MIYIYIKIWSINIKKCSCCPLWPSILIYYTYYPTFSSFMNLTETHMIMYLRYCLFKIASIFPNPCPGYCIWPLWNVLRMALVILWHFGPKNWTYLLRPLSHFSLVILRVLRPPACICTCSFPGFSVCEAEFTHPPSLSYLTCYLYVRFNFPNCYFVAPFWYIVATLHS